MSNDSQATIITWTSAFSVNNKVIDSQHQHLFSLTNRLLTEGRYDPEILNDTLYQLLQYAEYHFNEEEEQMKKANYPRLEEHIVAHRSFLRKIAAFCKDDVEGKKQIEEELFKYLVDWLLNHLGKMDQDYKSYL